MEKAKSQTNMKLKDIFLDTNTKIFIVTNEYNDDELQWTIEPTKFKLLPEEENLYFVKAFQVSAANISGCYIGIMTPERIAETVVRRKTSGKVVAESIYDQEHSIIPAVASDCFGDYDLFYAKENPQIGIDILKDGLVNAVNKNVVAEDLGYILRDEERVEDAIEAFKISEESGPSSEYIYLELSKLYKLLGKKTEQLKYEQKFKENGGIE